MIRNLTVLFLSLFIASNSWTVENSRENPRQFTLVARSGQYHGHQMPQKTFALNSSPAINSNGQISFNVITVEGKPNGGIWYGQKDGGKIVEVVPEGYVAADPKINPRGDAVFEVFDELKTLGVFAYLPGEGRVTQLYKPGEAFDMEIISSPYLNVKGDLFFLGRNTENQKSLVGKVDGQFFKYAEENQEDQISYMFTAEFNEKAQAAAKVRLGLPGDWNEGQPDEIRIWNVSGEMTVVARDNDADRNSIFQSFANSVDLNDRGDLVFRADLVAGGNGIFLYEAESGKVKPLALSSNFSEIEYFAAKLNNRGQAVFRAKDKAGIRAIYFFNGSDVEKVVQEGDTLPSDLGPVKIYFDNDHPGFGGSPGLNDLGEIVFLTSTIKLGEHDETYSKAVYVVK